MHCVFRVILDLRTSRRSYLFIQVLFVHLAPIKNAYPSRKDALIVVLALLINF